MRNWRTMVGAICIVVAMVLMVFTGFAYGRQTGVGAAPDAGTRGEDRRIVSASDELAKLYTLDEVEQIADDQGGATSILDAAPTELSSADGPVAKAVTVEETREALQHASVTLVETKDGSVSVRQADEGTRSHWVGGEIDAGGPYGGSDTFEGGPALTFTVQVFDPTVIFFRWDFDNDGVFDYPDQAGGGTLGRWTTSTTVTKQFLDNVIGDIVVEGWDGISTIITYSSGDNLGEPTSPYWYVYPRNSGHKFTPKSDLRITQLGMYQWFSMSGRGYNIRIWDVNTRTTLGSCTPAFLTYTWSWCTLASPVNVYTGQEYVIAEHKNIDYYPYFMGVNPSQFPTPPWEKITIGNFFYTWSTTNAYPATDGGNTVIMMVDFRWEETLVLPDATSDTATLEVNNVAPTVFNVVTNPSPALEGTPTQFLADFSDPGTDDTWEYRWIFHDGEVTPWRPVTKWSGGAKVLFLHTYAADAGPLRTSVAAKCGNFCIKIDLLDFGPTGENRVPALSELTPYDVVFVGTNYFHYQGVAMGNLVADYMDAGGNVVIAMGAMDNAFGCNAALCGRWDTDQYSPIPRGYIYGASGTMGTIYVPGHPLLDGVSSVSTSGLAGNIYTVNPGATRVVDWNNGRVLGAFRTNPIVDNGARSVAVNMFPILGYTGGDYAQMISNAIRFASRQPDPVLKSMPITLDALEKVYADDHPTTTTPLDSFPVSVEVRDDDHDKIAIVSQTQLSFENFPTSSVCNGQYYIRNTWPAGWSSSPNPYGWVCNANSYGQGRSPYILYYFNDPLYGTGSGHSYLYMPTVDLSGYVGVQFEFYTYWAADYPAGNQNGYVQASTDGGATWPHTLVSFHHNNPGRFQGDVSVQSVAVGGESDVRIRFYYQSADDWWWAVDNVRVTGVVGTVMQGLGAGSGVATLANVPPTVIGGFDSALRTEAQSLTFEGFEITDPALIESTEWFAYAWNFDDGTPVNWVYKGSLAPPRSDVLIVHSLCTSGDTCSQFNQLRNTLLASDTVDSITTWNFFQTLSAPSMSLLLQHDMVVLVTNWAYLSYPPFDLARRQVGDRLAQYIDAGRGGVLSFMAVYDLSPYYGDIFSINGRYIDDDYGAFERETYLFSASTLGTIWQPDHDLFVGAGSGQVQSASIHPGDMPLTVGGAGAAAGVNGQLLADWNDGNSAIGVKELNNGQRTAHIGFYAVSVLGADLPQLLRNAVGWVAGGIPNPKIMPFTHTWGDNGIYTVDLMVIDDDMGFVWDTTMNMPRQVLTGPGTGLAHRFVEVAVDNVDPTIVPGSFEAFIATQACVRVTGTEGNSVTGRFFVDGALAAEVTTVRMGGNPNVPTEKCGLMKVDVLSAHSYSATLTYSAPNGGSNPAWLIMMPWREPVNPGHGTLTYKYDFTASGQTISQPMPNLKQALLDSGQGAKIDFSAEAYDPGTDDLAFMWVWGTVDGAPYSVPNLANAVYTIHVYHNSGIARSDGTLDGPQYLGFSEAYFDVAANTGRSPAGTTNFVVRDTAVHAFDMQQPLYYVVLIVLDDDNTRGYPSTFGNDGIDMEFVLLDLR